MIIRTADTSLMTHMTPNPVTIDPEASLDEALGMLEGYGFRHLPVVVCNEVVGILSDRDLRLATSMLPSRRRLRDEGGHQIEGPKRVAEIMTAPVVCLRWDENPMIALREMVERQIGAIPIVEASEATDALQILGIVTETNFLQAFVASCNLNQGSCDDLVRYHMHQPLPFVSPTTSIQDALGALDVRVGHLAVLEEGRLVGILSQRDLMVGISREMIEDAKAQETGRLEASSPAVAVVMSTDVLTVTPGEKLSSCARKMIGSRVSALPVFDEGQPVGILTQRNVLEYYSSLVGS